MLAPIWRPTAEQIASANLTRFLQDVAARWQPTIRDYPALYRWSIERPDEFWQAVWQFCDVRASAIASVVAADLQNMPGATWFPGAKLNFAENLLRQRDDEPAIIFWNESGRQSSLTRAQLHQQVSRLARIFREWGIVPGDRVAGLLPNMPHAVVAMLAAASLGAIWSSCSPDFGSSGVLDRFGQIAPKVLIAADGYTYQGKPFALLDRIAEVQAALPSLQHVVIVPYLSPARKDAGIPRALLWDPLLASAEDCPLEFSQLPFAHPLYILYSSGTTGPPKCIVHGAGGTLLQHLKEHQLHTDLRQGDRLFYFTTCGWMMWNWLVTGLASGAAIVLYDGSPFFPHPQILFEMAQCERINIFGVSPRYLSALQKEACHPGRDYDLSHLRCLLSTGSPLSGEGFDYVYGRIKPDLRLSSISGGTDICSCFALGNPLAPVYRGQLQTRGLGMKVLIYNEAGQPVQEQKGELVCAAPFPSMPLGFWNDPGDAKYRQTYFERFPGVWHHGDFAELTAQDGIVIYGRSDAVLNPGGVRIGTAEIYRRVEQIEEVLESLAIAQDWQGDVRVVLFVKLRPGVMLDDATRNHITEQIRCHTSPRHVPARIVQVADIPRTKSGKIVELAVRDVVHGRPVRNLEALANPNSLDDFRDRPELAT